jgi:hypothetical protein
LLHTLRSISSNNARHGYLRSGVTGGKINENSGVVQKCQLAVIVKIF